jgi:uncharacterized membrane protein YdjX (TVP38/TMEM64 family)
MNKCNIDEMFIGAETTFNRVFNTGYTNFSQAGKNICTTSESNILFAVAFAFLLSMLEALLPFLPLTGIIILNNNLLGPLLGSTMSVLGSSFGAFILFYFARKHFADRFHNYLEKKNHTQLFDKISKGVDKHGILYLILMYGVFGLIVPSLIVTVSLALTSLRKSLFVIGLLLGKLVLVIQVTLFGEVLAQAFTNPKVLILVGIIVVAFIIIKRIIEKRSKNE